MKFVFSDTKKIYPNSRKPQKVVNSTFIKRVRSLETEKFLSNQKLISSQNKNHNNETILNIFFQKMQLKISFSKIKNNPEYIIHTPDM